MNDRRRTIANVNVDPLITFGICPTSEQGVAIAAYSGRRSRMWAWDAHSLEVLGFQDIKAKVILLDVTESGSHCAYSAEAHHEMEHYIAISRPPYFRALWLRNIFHLGARAVVFGRDDQVAWTADERDKNTWGRIIVHTQAPNTPFSFRAVSWQGAEGLMQVAEQRCSGARECSDLDEIRRAKLCEAWVGQDPLGRNITVRDACVCADDTPFLDCRRTPFVAVEPPEWAKSW